MIHPLTGSQRLLQKLQREHPKDRLGQADAYVKMALAEADRDPVKYKVFLHWFESVRLTPDQRALKLFNDLERQVAIDASARPYDLGDD
jgi:hypothetical protein